MACTKRESSTVTNQVTKARLIAYKCHFRIPKWHFETQKCLRASVLKVRSKCVHAKLEFLRAQSVHKKQMSRKFYVAQVGFELSTCGVCNCRQVDKWVLNCNRGACARPNFDPTKGLLFLCVSFLHAFIACLCNPEDLCPCMCSTPSAQS